MQQIKWFALLFILLSCSNRPNSIESVTFDGIIENAIVKKEIVSENTGSRYVKVIVEYKPITIYSGQRKEKYFIEYHYFIDENRNPYLREGADGLLNWDFHRGNIIKVNARMDKGNYVEEIHSAEDYGFIKWADDIGK